MITELSALLYRYYITYFRVTKRIISDFLLAAIIAGAIALAHLGTLGALASIVYILTLPFTFLVTVRTMLGEIVSEKSSGIKEYLKLNGLSNLTYQAYIFIITFVKTLFFTLFILVGILLGDLIGKWSNDHNLDLPISLGDTLIAYCCCGLATVSFILLLSTFFSEAKVASSVGGLLYVAVSLVGLIVFNSQNAAYYYLVCLFPQSALTTTLFLTDYTPSEVTHARINYVMLADFLVYLILYSYLDQVVKDENGVSKSWFFCLQCKKRRQRNAPEYQQFPDGTAAPLLQNETQGAINHDTSSAVYHEQLHGVEKMQKTVEVTGLTKRFGDFKAVDNISFSIYSGQIFCLLGHNGAGKTTTIKMLTGLLDIDGGAVSYDGENFLDNFEEARTKIGICSQNDIIFEKLKVHEHLELVAKLRRMPLAEISDAVEEAIRRVNLVNERDKFAEELSGGNKRKLCLAMAVLGKTKVIFLDEPTSGMDPQNRRVMWYHLKQLREQGMTILLTTHHLDEADELADRIAIMSKGKLLAVGTSEFFKKNFGVGYHLNIMPSANGDEAAKGFDFASQKGEIQSAIHSIVPAAKFDEQTANDVVKCSLPFAAQRDFPRLFAELEKNPNLRMNVEMNTLEDVFVNIGLSEDRLLHGESANTEINVHIQPPECLREKPTYSFMAQTYALAKRRVYLLTRSWRNIFLVILPLIVVFLGVLGTFGFEEPIEKLSYFQVVILFAYSLNTATYCSLPVYEREEKLKYLMDVMGLRNLPYWLGNVIIDFVLMTLINLVVFGLYAWFYNQIDQDIVPYLTFTKPADFLLLIVAHGLPLVTIGYAYSFLFDKALSAVKYFPLLFFFVLFTIGSYLTFTFNKPETSAGIHNPVLAGIAAFICPTSLLLQFLASNLPGFTVASTTLTLCAYGVLYFILTLILESRRLSAKSVERQQGWIAPEPHAIPVDANDVNFEKNRANQAREDPIKALDLVKIYDNGYTAVRDVTFGVSPGQIFGLLGPNGAGKSTTFNILTAAIPKSLGSVQLLDQEVNRNMPEVYENVGICPQFNGLWDFLTVKEHLVLFGNLKGLDGENLRQIIDYYLDVLQLREYTNTRAGALSGGNKRKLSVANAFIGSAHLIFLDEPSTGVDPLARRYLWNSIQQVLNMRKASVVLTTHSMYEAESLSHKIGILINGRFVCIGPTQYLKNKYSQGYKVTVSLLPNVPDPTEHIMLLFPQASRQNEASFIQQTYNLPFEGFRFSQAFERLEDLKEKGIIKDFSIYNTTLEQIFIYFSKFQISLDNNPQ